jgi:small subunit ribosomal protein S9
LSRSPRWRPCLAGLPRGLLAAEHTKARSGDPTAPRSALAANPYGWRPEVRLAKEAPLWMLYEEDRASAVAAPKAARRFVAGARRNPTLRVPARDATGRAYATGGRKTSSARVWVGAGDGRFTINRRPLQQYFERMRHRLLAMEPLTATQAVGAFDVDVSVRGGGSSGQAGAVRHGLARALAVFDPALKPVVQACA